MFKNNKYFNSLISYHTKMKKAVKLFLAFFLIISLIGIVSSTEFLMGNNRTEKKISLKLTGPNQLDQKITIPSDSDVYIDKFCFDFRLKGKPSGYHIYLFFYELDNKGNIIKTMGASYYPSWLIYPLNIEVPKDKCIDIYPSKLEKGKTYLFRIKAYQDMEIFGGDSGSEDIYYKLYGQKDTEYAYVPTGTNIAEIISLNTSVNVAQVCINITESAYFTNDIFVGVYGVKNFTSSKPYVILDELINFGWLEIGAIASKELACVNLSASLVEDRGYAILINGAPGTATPFSYVAYVSESANSSFYKEFYSLLNYSMFYGSSKNLWNSGFVELSRKDLQIALKDIQGKVLISSVPGLDGEPFIGGGKLRGKIESIVKPTETCRIINLTNLSIGNYYNFTVPSECKSDFGCRIALGGKPQGYNYFEPSFIYAIDAGGYNGRTFRQLSNGTWHYLGVPGWAVINGDNINTMVVGWTNVVSILDDFKSNEKISDYWTIFPLTNINSLQVKICTQSYLPTPPSGGDINGTVIYSGITGNIVRDNGFDISLNPSFGTYIAQEINVPSEGMFLKKICFNISASDKSPPIFPNWLLGENNFLIYYKLFKISEVGGNKYIVQPTITNYYAKKYFASTYNHFFHFSDIYKERICLVYDTQLSEGNYALVFIFDTKYNFKLPLATNNLEGLKTYKLTGTLMKPLDSRILTEVITGRGYICGAEGTCNPECNLEGGDPDCSCTEMNGVFRESTQQVCFGPLESSNARQCYLNCSYLPFCGDGKCDADLGENCSTCPVDCGQCLFIIGDGKCDVNLGENCSNSLNDCNHAPNSNCYFDVSYPMAKVGHNFNVFVEAVGLEFNKTASFGYSDGTNFVTLINLNGVGDNCDNQVQKCTGFVIFEVNSSRLLIEEKNYSIRFSGLATRDGFKYYSVNFSNPAILVFTSPIVKECEQIEMNITTGEEGIGEKVTLRNNVGNLESYNLSLIGTNNLCPPGACNCTRGVCNGTITLRIDLKCDNQTSIWGAGNYYVVLDDIGLMPIYGESYLNKSEWNFNVTFNECKPILDGCCSNNPLLFLRWGGDPDCDCINYGLQAKICGFAECTPLTGVLLHKDIFSGYCCHSSSDCSVLQTDFMGNYANCSFNNICGQGLNCVNFGDIDCGCSQIFSGNKCGYNQVCNGIKVISNESEQIILSNNSKSLIIKNYGGEISIPLAVTNNCSDGEANIGNCSIMAYNTTKFRISSDNIISIGEYFIVKGSNNPNYTRLFKLEKINEVVTLSEGDNTFNLSILIENNNVIAMLPLEDGSIVRLQVSVNSITLPLNNFGDYFVTKGRIKIMFIKEGILRIENINTGDAFNITVLSEKNSLDLILGKVMPESKLYILNYGQKNNSLTGIMNKSGQVGLYVYNQLGKVNREVLLIANPFENVCCVGLCITPQPPIITFTEISPKIVIRGNLVNISLNAIPSLNTSTISKYVRIIKPDGTNETLTLGDEPYSYNASLVGTYTVLFIAQESTGMKTEKTDSFVSILPVTSQINLEDKDGNPLNAILKVYVSGILYYEGPINGYLINNYPEVCDLEFVAFEGKISLKLLNVNMSNNLNKTIKLDNPPVVAGYLATYAAETNYIYSMVILKISYANTSYIDEDTLAIYRCGNWNISGRTCKGNWEGLSTDIDYIRKIAITQFYNLSGFSIKQETTYIINGTDGTAFHCIPNWTCTNWSTCTNNIRIRTCVDLNKCGTSLNKPYEIEQCTGGVEPTPTARCGNLVCDAGETCNNCPTDCGECTALPSCGDGKCDIDLGESCSTCPTDCGECKEKIKNLRWLWILIGVIVLVIIVSIVITLIIKKEKETASAESKQPTNRINQTTPKENLSTHKFGYPITYQKK